jgi:pimeloyl-ACP methyl ester carboxylesterase
MLTTRSINVPGGSLIADVETASDPTLVFLHYWGGSRRTFRPVIVRLTSLCSTVTFDQRGWGSAQNLPGPYGLEQLADDVLTLIRTLGLGRYVLVGHSMGGKVAQLVASRQPEGLAGLVLVAPSPPLPTIDATTAEQRSHAYDSRANIEATLQRALTHRPLPDPIPDQVIVDSLAVAPAARSVWPLEGLLDDLTTATHRIAVPVTVLAGEHDKVDPPADLRTHLLPHVPGAELIVIEDTGHLSPLEAPDRIAAEIDRFVLNLAARSESARNRQPFPSVSPATNRRD